MIQHMGFGHAVPISKNGKIGFGGNVRKAKHGRSWGRLGTKCKGELREHK